MFPDIKTFVVIAMPVTQPLGDGVYVIVIAASTGMLARDTNKLCGVVCNFSHFYN